MEREGHVYIVGKRKMYVAYETSSSMKNVLQYNVYHRCLCYFLNQATMSRKQ